jgi:uncharacterized protein YprB with RNaseH-like and TPR domain
MSTLTDKLKNLGVKVGTSELKTPRKSHYLGIENVIEGRNIKTLFGETFIHEELLPIDHIHGEVQLGKTLIPPILFDYAGLINSADDLFSKILFLDTETTGLSGGTGTLVFLVGVGYFSEEGFKIRQIFLRDPTEENSFLASLEEALAPFSIIATYNGKAFDAPLLNTRYMLNGLSSPLAAIDHLDLLPLARRIWKYRLESRSLKSLESEVIHFSRSQDEIPGWEIPQIYTDYLRSEDSSSMKGVFYHNAMDVVSLAAVFVYLNKLLIDPFAESTADVLDQVAIGQLFEKFGMYDQAIRMYETGLSEGLPMDLFLNTIMRFSSVQRKVENWEAAISIWEKGLAHQHLESALELAKYYEHHERNPEKALIYAKRAIEILELQYQHKNNQSLLKKEVNHRIDRLIRKITPDNP